MKKNFFIISTSFTHPTQTVVLDDVTSYRSQTCDLNLNCIMTGFVTLKNILSFKQIDILYPDKYNDLHL